MTNTNTQKTVVKSFEEKNIAEKFLEIAKTLTNQEHKEFLVDRAEKQTKSSSKGTKAVNADSVKLRHAVLDALIKQPNENVTALQLEEKLSNYKDDNKDTDGKATRYRIQAQLNVLVKEELVEKFPPSKEIKHVNYKTLVSNNPIELPKPKK